MSGVLLVRTSGPGLARTVETILLAQGAAFDLSGDIALNTAHREIVGGNPHGTSHNETTGKQGGVVDEYYHLTTDQNGAAVNSPTTPTAVNPYITVGDSIDRDALIFIMRVLGNGGVVEDVDFLDSFFKDAKYNIIAPYFTDLVAAVSPSWGVKGTATSSLLYSTTGAALDVSQVVGARQPLIVPNDLSGKTRLKADGVDDSMFSAGLTLDQPYTNIFMGLEAESWVNNSHLCSGANAGAGVVFQFNVTPEINQFSGSVSSPNSGLAVGTPAHLSALFDGVASSTRINDEAEVVSDAGNADAGGIYLFSDHNQVKNGNFSIGAYVVLGPTPDNYAAKLAAIKAFSSNAYGTP